MQRPLGWDVCASCRLQALFRSDRLPWNLTWLLPGHPQGGRYTVEGRMDSSASADSVFALLADYERVAEVFSNVMKSSTYRCVGADARLQQVNTVSQGFERSTSAPGISFGSL